MLSPAPVLPAALLPTEALQSLQRAFAREVRTRMPRLLAVGRGDGVTAEQRSTARADVRMLADGCALLGDAAAARTLTQLGRALDEAADVGTATARDLTDQAALLLGRWLPGPGED